MDYVNKHFRDHPNDLVRPSLTLKDGTRLSVQASAAHYCSPRESWESQDPKRSIQVPFDYTAVEVLAPFIPDWKEWAEDRVELSNDKIIYPYIPVELVNAYIEKVGLKD